MDNDIITTKPTIQIQGTRIQYIWSNRSLHHNHTPHKASLAMGKILTKIKRITLPTFYNPLQDIPTEIVWFTQSDVTNLPWTNLKKNTQPPNTPPNNIKTLIKTYQITHSYSSSPLTCPTILTEYNSPHKWHMIFGSTLQSCEEWLAHCPRNLPWL